MLILRVGTGEFQQDRGFFIGRHKGGQGMQGPRIGDMARQLHCHSEMGRFAPFHVAFGAFSDGEGLRYIGFDI